MTFYPHSGRYTNPVYFPANTVRPDPSCGPISRAECPLFGFVPSIYAGFHAGWEIEGKQYPANQFFETIVPGDYTGGHPVGLTPINKDWPFAT